MRAIKTFTAVPMLAIGLACFTLAGCPADTGGTDAGNEPDAVEPDDEPSVEPEDDPGDIGDNCTIGEEGDCAEGLVCFPNALNPNVGTCRQGCGALVDGVPVEDDPSPCTGTDTCQTVIVFDEASNAGLVGIACLPQQTARDAQCLGFADEDSCAESIATAAGVDPSQLECSVATSLQDPFYCKIGCEFGADGADESCPTGEQCLPDGTGRLTVELTDENDPNSTVECTTEACPGEDCQCSGSFECINTTQGNLCAQQLGTCGNAVAPTYEQDFNLLIEGGAFNPDLICNNVEDHRLCDVSFYEGLENPGSMQCIGISQQSADGVCFALCGFPATDAETEATVLDCPAEHECTDTLSSLSGVGFFNNEDPVGAPDSCDPANCTAGEPCPAECGPGDWICEDGFNGPPVCFAPVGTCEPVGVEVDAGPDVDGGAPVDGGVDEDAGAPVDGGADEDAGTPADAGTPTDAGSDTDAGVADAG